MKNIITERLTIRPFCESDKESMLALFYNDEIKKTYMIPDFESAEMAEKLFYTFMRLSDSSERFVCGVSYEDKLIGFLTKKSADDTENRDRIKAYNEYLDCYINVVYKMTLYVYEYLPKDEQARFLSNGIQHMSMFAQSPQIFPGR